jgi:hypothetical protein
LQPILSPSKPLPDLNAHAERCVRSVKEECLSRLIPFGEGDVYKLDSVHLRGIAQGICQNDPEPTTSGAPRQSCPRRWRPLSDTRRQCVPASCWCHADGPRSGLRSSTEPTRPGWSEPWLYRSTGAGSRCQGVLVHLRMSPPLPAPDEIRQDLGRSQLLVRRQQSLRLEAPFGIAHQDPSDGHDGLPRVIPNGHLRGDLDMSISFAVPICHGHRRPVRRGVSQDLLQDWPPPTLLAGPSVLPGLTGWGRLREGRVESQAGALSYMDPPATSRGS